MFPEQDGAHENESLRVVVLPLGLVCSSVTRGGSVTSPRPGDVVEIGGRPRVVVVVCLTVGPLPRVVVVVYPGFRQQVPSGCMSVQAEYWMELCSGPQQSPLSQLHPQLLFTSLHLPLPKLLTLPEQVAAHRNSVTPRVFVVVVVVVVDVVVVVRRPSVVVEREVTSRRVVVVVVVKKDVVRSNGS